MMGEQFCEGRLSDDYNAWFRNCHQFAMDMAYALCGNTFTGKWKLKFYFDLMPSAVSLLLFQQVRL